MSSTGSMDMNSIASMVEGGAGLAEGIRGYFQGQEGKKEMDALMANYPTWEIPKSYKDFLSTYQKLASGKMPGYDLAKESLDQTFAQSAGAAKEGALSSAQYQDTIAKLSQQSSEQKLKLDFASAQWQAEAQAKKAEALYKYGDLEAQQWNQNVNRLWNIKMNKAQAKYDEGTAAVQSGTDTFVQSGFDFAGSGDSTSGTSGFLQMGG